MKKFLKVLGIVLASLGGLAALAWVGLVAYFHFMAKDVPPADDSDLRIAFPEVPDAENAYVALMVATNLLEWASEDNRFCTGYKMFSEGPTNDFKRSHKDFDAERYRREVDRVLAERADGLAALDRLAALPKYWAVPDENGEWFPPISTMARASTLWQLRAVRARERGDLKAALASECLCMRFFAQCRDNAATGAEMLVGCNFGGSAIRRIVLLANEDGVSDEMLAPVADLLREDFDDRSAFERAMKLEYVHVGDWGLRTMDEAMAKADFLQAQQELYYREEVRKQTGRLPSPFVPPSVMLRFVYNRERTRQKLAEVFRAGLAGKSDDELEQMVPKPTSLFQPNWAGCLVVRVLTPSFNNIRETVTRQLLILREARVAVAAQRYRRANGGALPPTLDALVPAFLDAVPHDPYAPEQALGYDAAKGLVWSVGEDGDFNPLAEPADSAQKFRRAENKYAMRLDGKPHEKPMKKVKGKGQGQEGKVERVEVKS